MVNLFRSYPWRGVAVAASFTATVTLVGFALGGIVGHDAPMILYLFAILAAAWIDGLIAGLTATLFSALAGNYFFVEGLGWAIASPAEQLQLTLFVLVGIGGSLTVDNLRRARRREAAVIDRMPDACSAFDRDWRYTYVNRRWEELFGQPAARAIGHVLWEAFPRTVGTPIERLYRRVMAERVPVVFEVLAPYAETWLEVHAFPTDDGIACHIRDITDRRRQQHALALSEERYRQLTDASPHLIWTVALDRTIDFVNPAARRFTGWASDEPTVADWWESIHPDDREVMAYTVAEAMKRGEANEETIRLRRHDGEHRWVHTHLAPIRGADGQLRKWLVTGTDVHHRRLAELAERAANERFELVLRGANDGLWDWDLRDNVTYYSDRCLELWGYAPDEVPREYATWRDRIHPDDWPAVEAALEAHLRDRRPYAVVYRARTKSGEYRRYRSCGQATWDEKGRPVRMAGSMTDVTDARPEPADDALTP